MKISYAHFGNGMIAYMPDVFDPETHDCLTLAHISNHREIKYRTKSLAIKHLTNTVKQDIEDYAKSANPTISCTQDTPVFKTKV